MAGTYAVAKGWMHAFMRVVAAEQAQLCGPSQDPCGEGILNRQSGRCNGRAVTNKIATLANSAEERAVQRDPHWELPSRT
jgi:hypothetical protein